MFQELFNLLENGQGLTINLLKTDGKFIVSVLPKSANVKDEAMNRLIPLNLRGTPSELDEGFISSIANPVRKVSGMFCDIEKFEEKAEKAASESKALKDKTEKIAKLIKEAEGCEKDKPNQALDLYKKVLELDKYNSKIITKVNNLQSALSQGSLFAENNTPMPTVEVITNEQKKPEQTLPIEPIQPVVIPQSNDMSKPVDEFAALFNEEKVVVNPPIDNPIPSMNPDVMAQFIEFQKFQQLQNQN